MTENKSVDIMQEFVGLFEKEDMVSFFDFQHTVQEKESVSGFCKITKPKKGTTELNYLSLVFIIDSPDAETRSSISDAMKKFNEDSLKKYLPAIKTVISMPAMDAAPETYLKQVDIIFETRFTADKRFIFEELYPAIRDVTHFNVEEMSWWDDVSDSQATTEKRDARNHKMEKFLMRKLKSFFE
jgi:hypothetical protein